MTARLLGGALDALAEAGVADADIDVVWVPGAFELPGRRARRGDPGALAAVVCLGCVIRGGTRTSSTSPRPPRRA